MYLTLRSHDNWPVIVSQKIEADEVFFNSKENFTIIKIKGRNPYKRKNKYNERDLKSIIQYSSSAATRIT